MERHILREWTSSCLISSSWSQGVPTFSPPCKPYRQRWPNTSDRLRISRSTLYSDWTDCLKISTWGSHITWSPSGYTPAWPANPDALPPSRCLLITTWQLVKAHGVIVNKPKIHFNSHYVTYTYIYIYIYIDVFLFL